MMPLTAKQIFLFGRKLMAILLVLMTCNVVSAYSVLTHEEIVDIAWLSQIRPLLLERFLNLTPEQIKEAHAYAYGGSVIQDLGYYPFGNKQFSDLTHYVRSGDFVQELIRQSQDANEFAFALGALSHYTADINGHPAVNQAVALQYPKLRARYGRSVRYGKTRQRTLKLSSDSTHLQVYKNRYASEQYHDLSASKSLCPCWSGHFQLSMACHSRMF